MTVQLIWLLGLVKKKRFVFVDDLNKNKITSFFLFYFCTCRKRVIRVNSTEDDVNLVHREHGIGKQTKSIQVLFNSLSLHQASNFVLFVKPH